jgi:hypothetical protein
LTPSFAAVPSLDAPPSLTRRRSPALLPRKSPQSQVTKWAIKRRRPNLSRRLATRRAGRRLPGLRVDRPRCCLADLVLNVPPAKTPGRMRQTFAFLHILDLPCRRAENV